MERAFVVSDGGVSDFLQIVFDYLNFGWIGAPGVDDGTIGNGAGKLP